MPTKSSAKNSAPNVSRSNPNWLRRGALLLWFVTVITIIGYRRYSGLSWSQILAQLDAVLRTPIGVVAYLVLFIARSFLFLAAAPLFLLAFQAYGFVWGTIWATLGWTISSLIVYGFGRFFGAQAERLFTAYPLAAKAASRLQKNMWRAFWPIRALYLAHDSINVMSGLAKLPLVPFTVITLLMNAVYIAGWAVVISGAFQAVRQLF